MARDEHMITFAMSGLGKVTDKGIVDAAATDQQFECIAKVIAAADPKSRAIFFGFVGNAAAKAR
jgi:hypothetical protein